MATRKARPWRLTEINFFQGNKEKHKMLKQLKYKNAEIPGFFID